MGTTPNRPGDNDQGFAFLDFGDQAGPDDGAGSAFGDGYGQDSGAFLDFGDQAGQGATGRSAIDALVTSEPAPPAGTGSAPDLIDVLPTDAGVAESAPAADDVEAGPTATVVNPPETVSVTATMDGKVLRIELSPAVTNMSESGLADEILAIADLARQRALAIQQSFVLDCFHELGIDDEGFIAEALRGGVTELPSPQQAAAAQAEVFATRYLSDEV
ncbi:hypothetical protein AWC03_19980 [Mycobacterium europaeum]|uniref:hypothetical protein n=1 Tax=Mycobacterium europaeum TaxID=761804 RepID=UPI000A166828|nr:hypothetical protein [Mycobacterium europaeum]ORV53551.1 hypothetical protein AWC03_19980 [Mycobacterium europaeum]